MDIVPRVQISSGSERGEASVGSLIQALIGMMLSEKGMGLVSASAAANDKTGSATPGIAAE